MAEKRSKSGAILLRLAGRVRTLELFPAEAWPEEAEALPGTFRVREAKGRWLGEGKYAFYSVDGLARLLWRQLLALLGSDDQAVAEAIRPPDLPRGSRVRVWHGEAVGGMPTQNAMSTTATEPVQLLDGTWAVVVNLYGKGFVHVPCEHVEVIR